MSESEELEMLELENENAHAHGVASDQSQPSGIEPPSSSSFEVAGRSQPAMGATPAYAPGGGPNAGPADPMDSISPTRALLTNEKPSGYAESFMRGIPAQIGASAGGAAALGAGIAASPFTAGMSLPAGAGASVAGAAIGGGAGEAARQGLAQAYAGATGRPYTPPGQVLGNVGLQAALGAGSQAVSNGLAKAGGWVVKSAKDRLAPTLKQYFGIAEPITEYVQGQGSKSVFTSPNLNEGAALANVGGATADLSAARSAAGAEIGTAETARLGNIGDRPTSVRHIREGLEDALYGRGITDPKTAGLARGKEVGILNNLVDVLTPTESGRSVLSATDGISTEPVMEKLTLRQALNAKRLIDDNLEFSDQISKPTQALLERVNGQIRDSVRSDMGPGISKLWDHFGEIADAQKKLQEFTGTRDLSSVGQRAVQSLRGIMLKNPGEVDNIVKVLGAGLPGGEKQARTIFDSIAAGAFDKEGIGAPSNIILKGAAAVGITGGRAARSLVRGSEALTNASFNPAGVAYGASAAGVSPLATEYMRRQFAQ